MPPKIPEDVKSDLAEMNLVIWVAHHPITFDYEWTGNGPKRGRADKTRVHLQLAGPGVEAGPWGYGATVRDAVAAALRSPGLLARQGGLTGAMARLEEETRMLAYDLLTVRCGFGDDLDDDVPF